MLQLQEKNGKNKMISMFEAFLICYFVISSIHCGIHLTLYHSVKMIEAKIKTTRNRREPVHLYHLYHLRLFLIWPASWIIQVKDIISSIKSEK